MIDNQEHGEPIVVADEKRPVAAGVKHLFERLVYTGEQILYNVRSKFKSGLQIRGDVLGRHTLQQVNGATELICQIVTCLNAGQTLRRAQTCH